MKCNALITHFLLLLLHLELCESTIFDGISTCPFPSDLVRQCSEQCSSDYDCVRGRKCCSNGCGHSCEVPVRSPLEQWTRWTSCSVSCGHGTQDRIRQCSLGGMCPHPSFQRRACYAGHCPSVIPQWSLWSAWSQCPNSCKESFQIRSRVCSRQGQCQGEGHQTVPCPRCRTPSKNGTCPLPSYLVRDCSEQCTSDYDCIGRRKCCFNGCGHSCEVPSCLTCSIPEE